MTKLIAALIVAAVLFGVWELWRWYGTVEQEKEDDATRARATQLDGNMLSGMPGELDPKYQAAARKGVDALRTFMATYGGQINDPRKAWIQLDYCVLVSRENPAEARRIFAEVKARTSSTSKVWKRIEELSKSFE